MLMPVVLAINGLEDLINKALDLDAGSRAQLNALVGHTVLIQVALPQVQILLYLDQDRVRLTPLEAHEQPTTDAQVSATSVAYFRQLLKLHEPFHPNRDIQAHGDVLLLQELHRIAQQLDINWELALADVMGEVAAQQIGQGLRSFFGFARQAAQAFFQQGSNYLREHVQLFPERWQIDDFIEEVQDLRSDIERLEARIARLQAKRQAAANDGANS